MTMILAKGEYTVTELYDGATLYTWVVYANDENGSGITTNPEDKDYIGIAYNKTSPTPSMTVSHYDFAKIKGEQGIAGSDAESYTWIVYADTNEGEGISLDSTDKVYIGIAYNQDTPTPTLTPNLYQWNLMSIYVEEGINKKADSEDVDTLAGIVNDITNQIVNKAEAGTLETLIEDYNSRVAQDNIDKEAVSETLSTIDGRTAVIEKVLDDNKDLWKFLDTTITMSEEGIFVGNEEQQMGVLIAEDRISFMDKGLEVAYISNKTMEITHGIFVNSAKIGEHLIQTLPDSGITVFQWVGGDE